MEKSERLKEVMKGRMSLWYFVTGILGHREDRDQGWKDLCKEHWELSKFLEEDKRFKIVLMPRYSLKSCVCTVGYVLWRMVRNPNLRVLIYSDSAGKASGFLTDIKNHVLGKAGGSRFREMYGAWETDPHKGKWNDSQVIVKHRNASAKEPSIDTGGIETSKVGMHYDLIVFDDIVSDINVTTKEQMDKVWDCYKKSLSLLKPGGDVVVVGTRWNHGDAYGRMQEEGEFEVFLKKAEVDGRYPFESIGLDEEFIGLQKERQGSYFWSCLYQNDPVDPDTAIFKAEDFEFYGVMEKTEGLHITCACDPAGEGEDYTAFTVVGTDKEMRMYLLHASQGHYKPSRIISEIIRLSYGYGFGKLGVEVNTFNGMLERDLDLALAEERKNPKFRPFGVEKFRATCRKGEGKHARILSLQPFHERGDLVFPGESLVKLGGAYSELAYQMMRYTPSHRPPNDDLLDSLSYHVQMVRRGSEDVKGRPPEGSIMEIVERERERMNREQRRLPRKYRQYFEPVF